MNVPVRRAAERLVDRLAELLKLESKLQWEIADTLVKLHERGVSGLKDLQVMLARRGVHKAASTLSEYRATALAYPAQDRDPKLGYTCHQIARRYAAKFDLDPITTLLLLSFPDRRALHQVAERRGLMKISAAALGQPRNAGLYFAILDSEVGDGFVLPRPPAAAESRLEGMHAQDCIEVMRELPARSVHLLWLDPPYAAWDPRRFRSFGCSEIGRDEVDNADRDAALRVTAAAIREASRLLAADRAAILWQTDGPTSPEVMRAILESGLVVWWQLYWDKERPQAAGMGQPHATQCEVALVLSRPGEKLTNHAPTLTPRGNVLRISQPRPKRDGFYFAKPPDLCELLLRKHTEPGELVLDAFGGSGSMTLAAIRHGRRWIYCETNPRNFADARERIERATDAPRSGE